MPLSRRAPLSHRPCLAPLDASLNRLLQLLCLFGVCLHLCGGPLGLLQCAAWTGMLVNYSAKGGLAAGVEQTFDGAHPCCLCKAVAKAQHDDPDQNRPPSLPASELSRLAKDFSHLASVVVPAPVLIEHALPGLPEPLPGTGLPPPGPVAPPPRSLS